MFTRNQLHAVVDTSWKDLVPLPAKVKNLGIMTLQHVLKANNTVIATPYKEQSSWYNLQKSCDTDGMSPAISVLPILNLKIHLIT